MITGRLGRLVLAGTAGIAIVLSALVAPASAQDDGTTSPEIDTGIAGFEAIGVLPEPTHLPGHPDRPNRGGDLVALDPSHRRLYYLYHSLVGAGDPIFMREYDLDARVPQPTRDVEIGTVESMAGTGSAQSFALATEQRRLYSLGTMRLPNQGSAGASDPAGVVRTINLETLQVDSTWVLAERGLPGFRPYGITFAAQDGQNGRVYLVGEMSQNNLGSAVNDTGGPPASPIPMVVALEADSGAVAWSLPIQSPCRHLLVRKRGAMLGRSLRDPSLYTFCDTGALPQGVRAYPGASGALRIRIDGDATQADAAQFDLEFFPVPGAYAPGQGIAVFNPRADRVYATSLSEETPGAFVFDGERSAWVGHVAARDRHTKYLGMDEATGRLYMGSVRPDGSFGYLQFTDGLATPPPQATRIDGLLVEEDPVVDPVTGRVLVKIEMDTDEGEVDRWVVFEDTVPTIEGLPPPDHDAETADVAEGPDTSVNYTVVSSGFGAMGRLVGGAGNAGSYTDQFLFGIFDPYATLRNQGVEAEEPVVVSQGDRTVAAADVPSVQLAAFGATGDAQALATDDGTTGEIGEGGNLASEQGIPEQVVLNEEDDEDGDESESEGEETTVPVTDAAGSPYRKVECSDNGFDDDTTERSDSDDVDAGELEGHGAGTGHARVVCDHAGQQSQATANWRAGPTAEDAAGPAVAAAGFDTHLSRDPEASGAGTETVAVASGIELPVPEFGTLHVGEVRATAVTEAAGRPGTTSATWTRTVSGVVVTDADGAQLFPDEDGAGSCATVVSVQGGEDEERQEADNCGLLVDALNQLLQPHVAVTLPSPDLDATPKGAYAQVRQTDGDFHNGRTVLGDSSRAVPALQLLITNDGTEKSRLLLHLAAIDTSTIYQIQPCPFCSFDGGTDPDPAPAPTTEQPSPTPATTVTSQPAVGTAAAPPPPASLPVQQPESQSIDLAAAQPSMSEPEVAPQQALSLPGRIGAGLQLLTRDPVQALLVGGVWLLFAGALTTLLRRIRLRQLVSS